MNVLYLYSLKANFFHHQVTLSWLSEEYIFHWYEKEKSQQFKACNLTIYKSSKIFLICQAKQLKKIVSKKIKDEQGLDQATHRQYYAIRWWRRKQKKASPKTIWGKKTDTACCSIFGRLTDCLLKYCPVAVGLERGTVWQWDWQWDLCPEPTLCLSVCLSVCLSDCQIIPLSKHLAMSWM